MRGPHWGMPVNGNGPELALVALGVAGFAAFWVLVLQLISAASGWRVLAARYPYTGPPPSGTRRFRTGRLGGANYSGVLTVAATPLGLYLAVFPLFRPGHPALLVPWSQLRAHSAAGTFFNSVELEFLMLSKVRLRLLGDYPEMAPFITGVSLP